MNGIFCKLTSGWNLAVTLLTVGFLQATALDALGFDEATGDAGVDLDWLDDTVVTPLGLGSHTFIGELTILLVPDPENPPAGLDAIDSLAFSIASGGQLVSATYVFDGFPPPALSPANITIFETDPGPVIITPHVIATIGVSTIAGSVAIIPSFVGTGIIFVAPPSLPPGVYPWELTLLVTAVPEPGTYAVMGSMLFAVGAIRRRARNRS
jgi:hypothetical protein